MPTGPQNQKRSTKIRRGLERVSAAVHYVIARTEPSELGIVKLNKILWNADVEHYRRHGNSLTGLTQYTRMPQGPMSKEITHAVNNLKALGAIYERRGRVYDYTRHEFVWLTPPNIDGFTGEQIDLINQAISEICKDTAKAASDRTHTAYWQEMIDGEPMSIGAAAVVPRVPSQKQLEWARRHAG